MTDERTEWAEELKFDADATYLGFIQGLCWAIAADGNQGITFNQPNELYAWNAKDYFTFDLIRFFEVFEDYDSESPVMMLRRIDADSWQMFCTESDDFPGYGHQLDEGYEDLKWAAEWLEILKDERDLKTEAGL